jgi:hypothetical protein
MAPVSKVIDPKKNVLALHPNWPTKESVTHCQKTQQPFSFLFDRKFRCKVSGRILRETVCNIFQPNPDFGYYEPVRIEDDLYGLKSLDQIEDLLLVSYKKTEFLGLLLYEWENLYKHRSIVSYVSNSTFQLRVGPNPETSNVVALEIIIKADKSIIDDTTMKMSFENPETRQCLIVKVCEGIPESIVDGRRRRQREKAEKSAIERKQKDEERKKRNEARAIEAEKSRVARNKEKQATNATRRQEFGKVSCDMHMTFL